MLDKVDSTRIDHRQRARCRSRSVFRSHEPGWVRFPSVTAIERSTVRWDGLPRDSGSPDERQRPSPSCAISTIRSRHQNSRRQSRDLAPGCSRCSATLHRRLCNALRASACSSPTVGICARAPPSLPACRVPCLATSSTMSISFCLGCWPIVLDFDQPGGIVRKTNDVDRLRTACDGLKLVAIERPFVVLTGFAVIRKRELEIAFFDSRSRHEFLDESIRLQQFPHPAGLSGSTPLTSRWPWKRPHPRRLGVSAK